MNLNVNVDERLIVPSVINLEQYSTSDKLVFQLDKLIFGQIDLSVCKAFVVTQFGDVTDETECTIADNLITWNVSAYTTQTSGTLTYQIRLVENNVTQWYSKKCVCLINSSIEADDYIAAMYPSILIQWKKRMDELINEGVDEDYLRQLINDELTAYTTTSQMNALLSTLETTLKTYTDGKTKAVQDALDVHLVDKSNPHNVTLDQLNAYSKTEVDSAIETKIGNAAVNYDPQGSAAQVEETLDFHKTDTTNPHSVTAEQTGAYTKKAVDDAISSLNTSLSALITALQTNKQNSTISIGGYTTIEGAISGINTKIINLLDGIDNLDLDTIKEIADKITSINTTLTNLSTSVSAHTSDENNPHGVTASDVGLGSVDNTSDAEKPVSTDTQTELNKKVDKVAGSSLLSNETKTSYDNHLASKSNPHSVTATDVGLGNVNNVDQYSKTEVDTKLGDLPTYKDELIKIAKEQQQLLNIPDVASTTVGGITYSVSNGVITLNGTSDAGTTINVFFSKLAPNTYTFKSFTTFYQSGYGDLWFQSTYRASVEGTTFTTSINIDRLNVFIAANKTFTNFKLMPMLVNGSIPPAEFQAYKGAIVHQSELESAINAIPKVDLTPYAKTSDVNNSLSTKANVTDLDDVKARLDALGFKQGSLGYTGINASYITNNTLKRQGNYCLLHFSFVVPSGMASATNFKVPEGFRPKDEILNFYASAVYNGFTYSVTATYMNGEINTQLSSANALDINIGWEC